MLTTLHISNYALIDHLEVTFDPGLTIITGETGAGKSIILGALSLILGERASAQAIRDKQAKTVVEATFAVDGFGLEPYFDEIDVDYCPECILRREVGAGGRSRAFVNDTPVQLATLKQLATRLVDIHSQHSNMLLATAAFQLRILDTIAHHQPLLDQYAQTYQQLTQAERDLEKMRRQLAQAQAEHDYIAFQCNQLQQMRLTPGEDQQLEALQRRLAGSSHIKQTLWLVHNDIDGDDTDGGGSMLSRLKQSASQLAQLETMLPEAAELSQRTSATLIELKDIAATVQDLLATLESDPEQLERVETRLGEIYDLERKLGADSVDALLDLQHDYEARLAAIDGADEQLAQRQAQVDALRSEATALACRLTEGRQQAAAQFEQQLLPMATELGLKNLRFHVDFSATALTASGADAVDFMMAFNKNQAPMPLRDTASGGEMSRIMLCIKAIIASTMNLPTIIFDEVDTGVSGDVASRIGAMMAGIARSIQVIAITHLPQVASHGQHHYQVYKTDEADSTLTSIRRLDDEQHVLEIARMLSGRQLDEAAIRNAQSLISQNTTK